jgi:hypothetical protein
MLFCCNFVVSFLKIHFLCSITISTGVGLHRGVTKDTCTGTRLSGEEACGCGNIILLILISSAVGVGITSILLFAIFLVYGQILEPVTG